MWYFAYGSNLCTAQMAARTGVTYTGANRPRRVRLPGYRLVFNMGDGSGQAFANIMRSVDRVLGVLYQCSEQELELLDGFERGYDRQQVEVLDEAGTRIDAVAYIAKPDYTLPTGRPSPEYLGRIVRGAREHGLPEEYIHSIEAVAGVPAEPEAG